MSTVSLLSAERSPNSVRKPSAIPLSEEIGPVFAPAGSPYRRHKLGVRRQRSSSAGEGRRRPGLRRRISVLHPRGHRPYRAAVVEVWTKAEGGLRPHCGEAADQDRDWISHVDVRLLPSGGSGGPHPALPRTSPYVLPDDTNCSQFPSSVLFDNPTARSYISRH